MEMNGKCHCGNVRFRTHLAQSLDTAIRCNCSLCRMRGAVIVFARMDAFEILSGADFLISYRFNTKSAEHFFCRVCGVYTHHQRRFDPTQYAVNAACLEGISPFDFAKVSVVDGVRHPLGHGGGDLSVIGSVQFIPD